MVSEFYRIGTRWKIVCALNDCAMLACDLGQSETAAQLFGAADALGDSIQYRLRLSVSYLRAPRAERLRQCANRWAKRLWIKRALKALPLIRAAWTWWRCRRVCEKC